MAHRRTVYRSPHVKVEFEMDRKGIAEIAMGPRLREAVLDFAENEAKPYAVSISPRSDRQDHVHYADSFHVVPGAMMIRGMRRVAAHLINSAEHAAAVEWGNERVPRAQRILGRTLDHFMQPNLHNDGLL